MILLYLAIGIILFHTISFVLISNIKNIVKVIRISLRLESANRLFNFFFYVRRLITHFYAVLTGKKNV